jgi:hypothetical protein
MTMRIANLFLYFGLICFAFPGCTKTGGSTGSSGTSGNSKFLVKSFETTSYDTSLANTMDQFTISYTYDNSNRQLSGIEEGTSTYKGTASNISDTFNFSYGQNTKTETGNVHQGSINASSSIVNYLNSSGYADSAFSTSSSGNFTILMVMMYHYDANNYCTEIDYTENINNAGYLPTGKTMFTITGGNVTQAAAYDGNGNPLTTQTLTYTNSSNNTEVSPSIPPLSGHLNNNLVQSTSISTLGTLSSSLNYSYTYDSQNRVSSISVTTPSGKNFLLETNIQYVN